MAGFLGFRPDIPFAKDDSNRFLPWIIGFIVFIAAMMVASGIGLYSVVSSSQQAGSNMFSIHVPATLDNADQAAGLLVETLKVTPGVEKAQLVSAAEMQELMKPWLGTDTSLDSIPLPRIIDVTFSGSPPDVDNLTRKIQKITPGATVDDHSQWIAQYASLISGLQWSLWIAAVLFMLVTLAIVVLTTRASIKIHHRVIMILHAVGALDSYIAKQFQFNALHFAVKGAIAGTLAAFLFYFALCAATEQFDVPLLPAFHLGFAHIVLFLFFPLMVGAGAMYSSRLTVLAELKRMP